MSKSVDAESSLFEEKEMIPSEGPPVTASFPTIRLKFDSADALLDYIDSKKTAWQPKQGSIVNFVAQSDDLAREFGTRTWGEAKALARDGWPAGRDMLIHAGSELAPTERRLVRSTSYDVAGYFPDVPRFIAGDPENMVSVERVSRSRSKAVRVVVSPICAIAVSPEARARWGAGLLSWIGAQERQGLSVEIDVCYISKPSDFFYTSERKLGPPVLVQFNLQRTNAYLSIDRLAFWLMHTAAHRRIQFAVREKLDIGKWYGLQDVYGRAVTNPNDVRRFIDTDALLLVLGEGSASTQEALEAIHKEVDKWECRQSDAKDK